MSCAGCFILLVHLLVISFPATAASANAAANASPVATRLNNGLELLSYSLPEAAHTRVILKMGSGSFSDTAEFPGVAHLLEHLVLRQPVSQNGQSLRQWLQANGGKLNATTGYNDTVFEFSLPPEILDQALAKLRQVLAGFQTDSKVLHSELAVLDQEYALRSQQPIWQQRDVLKVIAHKTHPLVYWHPGNSESLLQQGQAALSQAVHEQFKHLYRPGNLRLILMGPGQASHMQLTADKHFATLPAGSGQQRAGKPLFSPDSLPATLAMPGDQQRILTLLFPVDMRDSEATDKAGDYLAYLLTRKQEQGLIMTLKKAGLVGGLIAGESLGDGGHRSFHITLSLTPKGWDNPSQVIAQVQAYLQLVSRSGLSEPVLGGYLQFQHLKSLFADESDTLKAIQQQLLNEPLARLRHCPLTAPSHNCHSDAGFQTSFNTLVSQLKANNQIRIFTDTDISAHQKSPLFETAYSLKPAPAVTPATDALHAQSAGAQMKLPVTDPYFKQLTTGNPVTASVAADKQGFPFQLQNNGNVTLWYGFNDHKGKPLAEARILFTNTGLTATPTEAAQTELYVIALNERLQVIRERLADLFYDFRLQSHPSGLYLEVRGYSQGLTAVVNHLVSVVQTFEPPPDGLVRWKAKLAEKLQQQSRYGFEELYEFLYSELLKNYWPADRLLAASKTVEHVHLQNHSNGIFPASRITAFYYGNITADMAEAAYPPLAALSTAESAAVTPIAQAPGNGIVYPLPHNRYQISIRNQDNAMVMFHQASNSSPRTTGIVNLLQQLMHKEYFRDLRTQQGLGYAVFVAPMSFYTHAAFALTIQSAQANPEILETRTNQFLSQFSGYLDTLQQGEFEKIKQTVASRLNWQLLQGQEKTDRFWKHIQSGTLPDPQLALQQTGITEQISLKDIRDYFHNHLTGEERKLFVFASQSMGGTSP